MPARALVGPDLSAALNLLAAWPQMALWLCGAWLSLSLACGLVWRFERTLGFVSLHGKLTKGERSEGLAAWTVPKAWFSHMYVVGIGALVTCWMVWGPTAGARFHQASAMFAAQILRRAYESFFTTSYGQSRMHVGGYLVGLLHYILVPLSLSAALGNPSPPHKEWEGPSATIIRGISLSLFCAASWFQADFHRTLSGSDGGRREEEKGEKRYILPTGFGFDAVCCPHYTAEVLVYSSLALLSLPTSTSSGTSSSSTEGAWVEEAAVLISMVAWVGCNLGVVALRHREWYRESFPRRAPASHWGGWLPCLCSLCVKACPLQVKGGALTAVLLLLLSSRGAFGLSVPSSSSWSTNVGGLTQDQMMTMDTCILVDENDAIVGQASKHDAHRFQGSTPRGLLHRAFSVFLFDNQNRLLLQQRASSKVTFPSVWTNTCCSHPLCGYEPSEVDGAEAVAAGTCDGVKRAARRKLQHELGLADSCLPTSSQLQYVTRLLYSAPCPPPSEPGWGESEVDYILLARLAIRGEDVVANEDEVRAVRFVTQDELQGMLADPALSWSPWFRIIADKFLGQWWKSLDTLLLQDQEGGGGGGLLDRDTIHKVM